MRRACVALLPTALAFASTAQAAVTATAVRETQKIRPTDPAPPAQSSIALSCARNEFCAFQVAVTAPASAAVTVNSLALGNLTGCAGALTGSDALVYREGFMDVTTPSNSAGATGQWPDPMIPVVDAFYGETRNAVPATVAAGQTQAFWVELLVPPDQAPGSYTGAVTVTASDMSTATIDVSLQVRGFTLPSTSSLGSAYGFDWDGPCVGHFGGYGGANCDDQQLEALNALYFQDALNHRLTISALVYAPPITNGTGSFTTFDMLYGPFLNGTALTGKAALQGAQITSIEYVGDQVSASYAAWATHAKANGWFDRVFDYTCDEPPNGCAWTDIPTRAAIVHGGDPSFRTLTTTTLQNAQTNGVLSSLDILVPIINEMDPSSGSLRASYDTFLMGTNALLWMYQSCEPSSSCSSGTVGGDTGWPTMFIDETALSNRMMQWMDFLYQVSAELYYDTTYAMSTQDAWTSQYEFGNNGDGSIWYPGKPSLIGGTHDIPIQSFRMKMLREGMQDYEYLHMLTALGDGAFAQTELATVVTAGNGFASDPSVLEQARLDMATEIEKDLAAKDAGVAPGASCDGGASDGGVVAVDGSIGGDSGSASSDGTTSDGASEGGSSTGSGSSGGCGCGVATTAPAWPLGILLVASARLGRRRRRPSSQST
jgi:MYXO-CTERM domain-containing protein